MDSNQQQVVGKAKEEIVDVTSPEHQVPTGKDAKNWFGRRIGKFETVAKRLERRMRSKVYVDIEGHAEDMKALELFGKRKKFLRGVVDWTLMNCEKSIYTKADGSKLKDWKIKGWVLHHHNPLDNDTQTGAVLTELRLGKRNLLSITSDVGMREIRDAAFDVLATVLDHKVVVVADTVTKNAEIELDGQRVSGGLTSMEGEKAPKPANIEENNSAKSLDMVDKKDNKRSRNSEDIGSKDEEPISTSVVHPQNGQKRFKRLVITNGQSYEITPTHHD